MLITRRALRSFPRGTARPIKVVWGFNGWDRCRESDYAKAPRLVYSCCKQLSCGCCANARSLQIREGVRAGPGRLRAAEEFEQRLRLRSRALSFRHHRRPPSRTESQRLSYCGEDIRRYGERSEPTTPLTPRYLNTARRSNTLTAYRRHQSKSRKPNAIRRIPQRTPAHPGGTRREPEGGHVSRGFVGWTT